MSARWPRSLRNVERIGTAVLFVAVAICAVAPVRSYDFFWHLATGRWIIDHRALPLYDPLAVASAHVPWINGEWLWEAGVAIFGSIPAIVILHALTVGLIFALGARNATSWLAAAIAYAGAWDRLGVRPSTAAALFLVIALMLLGSRLEMKRLTIAYALLTGLWINVHPSALLAPILALIAMRWAAAGASAVALLVNPFGWRAIMAPLELSRAATSGEYVNAEWLPSPIRVFPLLYITIAAVLFLFAWKRKEIWRFLVFALLAYLAVRYVRNQGLYFAALPLLVAPLLPPRRWMPVVAALILVFTFTRDTHRIGIDETRFPVHAVARLRALNLPGNIYNADQFGGYLEWAFYPQRRVLTDGRNELFLDFIRRDARARVDSRAWHALIHDYNVDIAVDEYLPPMTVFDVATRTQREMPASVVRYPPRTWALIAFDDVAMVFARRAAFPNGVPEIDRTNLPSR